MIDHRSYARNLGVVKLKPEKKSGLNRIRTHDLCDTGTGGFFFFSGFNFTTAQDVCITLMIIHEYLHNDFIYIFFFISLQNSKLLQWMNCRLH